jgi:hypothetical protein
MSFENTIRMLLTGARAGDASEWRRIAARVAWAEEISEKWLAMHRRVDAAWDRIFDALPDDIDDDELEAMHIPEPPEQAELDALHAEIWAVIDHDRWPKHLYFGGV